jgi:hypothetical protein
MIMTRDKQLINVDLDEVIEKRRLDQALNAKEFAVLAGVSYSAARAWFRQPGFPAFSGVVFWQDFVQWRNAKIQSLGGVEAEAQTYQGPAKKSSMVFTGKAAQLLAMAG